MRLPSDATGIARIGLADEGTSSVRDPPVGTPSGTGSRRARIHSSCAVVVAPTLSRAFTGWCLPGADAVTRSRAAHRAREGPRAASTQGRGRGATPVGPPLVIRRGFTLGLRQSRCEDPHQPHESVICLKTLPIAHPRSGRGRFPCSALTAALTKDLRRREREGLGSSRSPFPNIMKRFNPQTTVTK